MAPTIYIYIYNYSYSFQFEFCGLSAGSPNSRILSVYCTHMYVRHRLAWVSYKNNDPTENVFRPHLRRPRTWRAYLNRRRVAATFCNRSPNHYRTAGPPPSFITSGRYRNPGSAPARPSPGDITDPIVGIYTVRGYNKGFIFSPFVPGFNVVSRTHGPGLNAPNPIRIVGVPR